MAIKRRKPEAIVTKFRQEEILAGKGMTRLRAARNTASVSC